MERAPLKTTFLYASYLSEDLPARETWWVGVGSGGGGGVASVPHKQLPKRRETEKGNIQSRMIERETIPQIFDFIKVWLLIFG